jgi:hypothetical protein
MKDLLYRLQRWFVINCNGDWEHGHPISITTVDNPGWAVTIPLQDTCLQNARLDYVLNQRSPTDWVGYLVRDGAFEGNGGAENLSEILSYFLDNFLPAHLDASSTLELYVPVIGYEGQLWIDAEARMLSESAVEIVAIGGSSCEWSTNEFLETLDIEIADMQTAYKVGDALEPDIFQAPDNILRTFLVAPSKAQ